MDGYARKPDRISVRGSMMRENMNNTTLMRGAE